MPGWGLIPDSPWIYYGQRLARRRRTRRPSTPSYPRKAPFNIRYGYSTTEVIIYKPVLNFEMKNRYGMVGRHLHGIGNQILQGARRQVGVKTGALQRSLKIEHLTVHGEAAVKIGSTLHYARLHHDGTRPHKIAPTPPNTTLVFSKGSKIITTKLVNHPGNRPNRYLSDQLRLYVKR
jgi:hypothetical protein